MLFEEFDEQKAIEELQERGYRITKADLAEAPSISTVKDLVDYFYARRFFYNSDRKFPQSRNYKDDTKYMSAFVKKRQKLGLGRKAAIREAAMLIDTLFKFEEHLKLQEPVLSPRFLAIDSFMDRVCSFANGEVDDVNDAETEEYIAKLNEEYNKEFAQRDLELAAANRKEILEKMYGQRCGDTISHKECD